MYSAWQKTTRTLTTAKTLAFIATLTAITLLPTLANPDIAHATICGVTCTYSDPWGTQEVTGSGWLTGIGGGVPIYSNGPLAPTGPSPDTYNYINNVNGVNTQTGVEWQCVELVNRLYISKGWITSTWTGNGNQLYANAPTPPLTKQANGSVTNLAVGDVLSMSNGSGPGHAAVVNSVSGSAIGIASQNTNAVYDNTAFTISGGTISTTWSNYSVIGIIHHPNTSLRSIPTSDGHIQLFKISNGVLSENWYNPPDGHVGTWTQPVAMPSTPTGTPAVVQRPGQNKIDVFVRGGNNQIYETWYDFSNAQWGGWVSMGGTVSSDPQVVATSDGHYQIFGTGNNLVQQYWWAPDGSHAGGWTTSAGLGANAVGSPALASRAGQDGENVIDEFVRGGDNQIYETWYSFQSGGWGGWYNMGGTVVSDPQTQQTSDGHDQVFGTGNNLVQQNWFALNGTWGNWKSF